jgi:hypothetical protein
VESLVPEVEWRRAFRDITEFERTLADDGTLIIKFFLHISKQEQKRRFEKLSKDTLTAWHVSPEDWEHHRRYDDWLAAYEEALESTDTEWGPWTIVEATDRRYTWVKIFQTVADTLAERLGMQFEPLQKLTEESASVDSENQDIDEQAVEYLEEPSGEDSDDENPYGLDDQALESAMASEDVSIKEAQDEWSLEESDLQSQ